MDRNELFSELMADRGWVRTGAMTWAGGMQHEFRQLEEKRFEVRTASRLIVFLPNNEPCIIRIADFTKLNWNSSVDLCWPDEFIPGCMVDFDFREPDSVEKLESWLDAYGCKRLTTSGKVARWVKGLFRNLPPTWGPQ